MFSPPDSFIISSLSLQAVLHVVIRFSVLMNSQQLIVVNVN